MLTGYAVNEIRFAFVNCKIIHLFEIRQFPLGFLVYCPHIEMNVFLVLEDTVHIGAFIVQFLCFCTYEVRQYLCCYEYVEHSCCFIFSVLLCLIRT